MAPAGGSLPGADGGTGERMRQQRAAPPTAARGRPWFAAAGAALIVAALAVTGLARRYVVAESAQFVVFAMAAPALIVLGAPWRLLRLSNAGGPEPGQPGTAPPERRWPCGPPGPSPTRSGWPITPCSTVTTAPAVRSAGSPTSRSRWRW